MQRVEVIQFAKTKDYILNKNSDPQISEKLWPNDSAIDMIFIF